nr:AAA family ATPase [Woeseia oceani]
MHAPGTLRNDQFGGDWDTYIRTIETADPPVRALGVTDYFCVETYKQVAKRKADGQLLGVDFIFPNVEMRLDIKTEKKRPINLHLLFSPSDAEHCAEIERILGRLEYEYQDRTYRCNLAELEALGRAHNPQLQDSMAALRAGANQFKTTLPALKKLFKSEAWLQRNCLVAVAGSSNDGTAGLQKDDSYATTRQEIERFADIIFASTPSQIQFWLGKNPGADRDYIERTYRSVKPCMHGCDAHQPSQVVAPKKERNCWIKGDLHFESLRQAVIEPQKRVFIGPLPPDHHQASYTIDRVETNNASWHQNGEIELNSDLVAIIGARGSGKTALADMIAAGTNAIARSPGESSFVKRASVPIDHLGDAIVEIQWKDGTTQEGYLNPKRQVAATETDEEGVRYLSQHFVDQLCSSAGLATELRKEMERVVFEATDPTQRLESASFEELAKVSLEPIRRRRQETVDTVLRLSDEVVMEESLLEELPGQQKSLGIQQKRIEADRKALMGLMPKGKEQRAKRLARFEKAHAEVTAKIEGLERRKRKLGDLQAEVKQIATVTEPARLADMKNRYSGTELSAEHWASFGMGFEGDVEKVINEATQETDKKIKQAREGDPANPIDRKKTPEGAWPLNALTEERDKLRKDAGIDANKQKKYEALQKAITRQEAALRKLAAGIAKGAGAKDRRAAAIASRRKAYLNVFSTLIEEENELRSLYAPLAAQLTEAAGSLAKLQFVVRRCVDLAAWVEAGEELFDLRRSSRLRGRGSLLAEAEQRLLSAWSVGSADDVADAMDAFRAEFARDLVGAIPGTIEPESKKEWIQTIAAWLYDTSHIKIEYGITYDSVAIEQLSPGTRGIVLLLLFLVLDKHDRRPLIVDQPEENLDPNSVFEELVPHFREASNRRQVVVVTHNANLVVNTDSDQIIVASSRQSESGGLPKISYQLGSLENPDIRKAVCEILEGGERAFLERERRYRLRWGDQQN